MTEKAEQLLKEFDKLEQDVADPYEAASKIAGIIWFEGVMMGLSREETDAIAKIQLRKHLIIGFDSKTVRMAEEFEPIPDEVA